MNKLEMVEMLIEVVKDESGLITKNYVNREELINYLESLKEKV